MPDNTNESWGAFLLRMAEEAQHDSDQHDTSTILHEVLKDLALVATAYAGRLGIDKSILEKKPEAETPPELQATEAEFPEPPLRAGPLTRPIESATPEAVNALAQRIADLEAKQPRFQRLSDLDVIIKRFEAIEARLDAHERRLEALENRAALQAIAVSPEYMPEAPEQAFDSDPTAWDTIDRARAALRGMLLRQHRTRIGIRQNLLSRVMHLAALPERGPDEEAELRQKKIMVDAQEKIDAVNAHHQDRIAALDDLELARAYAEDLKTGWP